jgi:hypothetical protein
VPDLVRARRNPLAKGEISLIPPQKPFHLTQAFPPADTAARILQGVLLFVARNAFLAAQFWQLYAGFAVVGKRAEDYHGLESLFFDGQLLRKQ